MVEYNPLWVTAQDPKTQEILNGAYFKYANVQQSQTGQPVVIINFDDKGKEIFCNITEEIVGKQLAIFVGGQLVTAPVIREKICGGSAQIDGQFDMQGAKQLVDNLNEGALPAPLILAHEEKVSPTLGEQALVGAFWAAVVGLVLIGVFMFSMYGWRQGLVAMCTLFAFLIILFAFVKIVGYALSLSGIAAILLSIGMGVDANVLIYERVREERAEGKSIATAIEDGYQRSLSAIRDGNLTTFMIALLLFFMGTNVFKGFGTMMMVNIILTLVVIVPFTR
ncbi:MAG: protein translocase subunit SecD [Candidatus Peribacteria bacterium]|nr:MAG: protein translocase subunit SecD [Candidatus Peribacteria bacterium]